MKEDIMYKVTYTDTVGKTYDREFDNLGPAMDWAKTLAYFVTISGGENVIVGKFGADSVEAGVLPDGTDYTWRKRR